MNTLFTIKIKLLKYDHCQKEPIKIASILVKSADIDEISR